MLRHFGGVKTVSGASSCSATMFYAIPEVVEYYSLQKRDEDAGF